jgi:hypothetical protein
MKGITPKPLDKEDLNSLELGYDEVDYVALVAAEQYWREAVKNRATPREVVITTYEGSHQARQSVMCKSEENTWEIIDHDPDCPWLKAQE